MNTKEKELEFVYECEKCQRGYNHGNPYHCDECIDESVYDEYDLDDEYVSISDSSVISSIY